MGQFKIVNHTQGTESDYVCSEWDCWLNKSFTARVGDQLSLFYAQRGVPLPAGTRVHFMDRKTGGELSVDAAQATINTQGWCNPWWSTNWAGVYEIYAYDEKETAGTNIITLTIEPAAPPPVQFTLTASKTAITSGETVTFSGKYKPNTTINIFIEGFVRTHVAQTTTDSNGNFTASAKLTSATEQTVQIGACTAGGLYVYECSLFPDKSNLVSITITPPAPVLKYKCSGAPNYACTQAADGTYDTLAACQAACKPPAALKYKCSGAPDYACTQAADGTYDTLAACQAACKAPPPPQFTLSADKTAITSGDRVTFSGKYKPNTEIGLYFSGALTFLAKTTTDGAGNFVVSFVLSSAVQQTASICACVPSVIPGTCAIGEIKSNCVSITITPIAPVLKYKCSGAPNYACTQATDGTYDTLAACQAACKPPAALKYKCSGAPDYACTQAVDGIYATLVECQAVCKPPAALKYKCSGAPNYSCVQAADGIYDTLAECQAACKAPAAGTGTLIFVTNPAGAEIYLGGMLKGRTNEATGVLTLLNIPAGTIKYTVKKSGYNDSSGTVVLPQGEQKTIYVTLTSGVSATTAIVVALLGVGVIGAVIMARRRKIK